MRKFIPGTEGIVTQHSQKSKRSSGAAEGSDHHSTSNAGIPKNMEDYIRANNAHLQVILKTQAEIMGQLQTIFNFINATRALETYPGNTPAQKANISHVELLAETFSISQLMLLKKDVEKTYLEITLEKYH